MRQPQTSRPSPNRVEVVWACTTPEKLEWMRFGKRWALTFLRDLHLSACGLSLAWVGDAAMQKLNHRFRGQNKTTDVLSFPSGDMPQACVYAGRRNAAAFSGFLGDIAISLPMVCRRADQWDIRPQTEAKRYLAHGLLHLLGHDHHAKAQAHKMAIWERRLLHGEGMVQG